MLEILSESKGYGSFVNNSFVHFSVCLLHIKSPCIRKYNLSCSTRPSSVYFSILKCFYPFFVLYIFVFCHFRNVSFFVPFFT